MNAHIHMPACAVCVGGCGVCVWRLLASIAHGPVRLVGVRHVALPYYDLACFRQMNVGVSVRLTCIYVQMKWHCLEPQNCRSTRSNGKFSYPYQLRVTRLFL